MFFVNKQRPWQGHLGAVYSLVSHGAIFSCYMRQSESWYCLWLAQWRFKLFRLIYFRDLFERGYATVETSGRDFQQCPEDRLDAVLGAPKYICDVICQEQAPTFLVFSSHVLYQINIWLEDHTPYLSFTSKYLFRHGVCAPKVTENRCNTGQSLPFLFYIKGKSKFSNFLGTAVCRK